MEKPKEREHDFSTKLRQASTIQRLREYIMWQRSVRKGLPDRKLPRFSPISINLDPTSACNFSCSYCVDSGVINTGKSLKLGDVRKMVDLLHAHGLLSVIFIGGGEPTLHRDFAEMVRTTKQKGLGVGIVTNGSRMDRIAEVVDLLREKDWIRISIDAATEETFQALHQPKTGITLKSILEGAKKVKGLNPRTSLGYSFLILWDGLEVNGQKVRSNLDEMASTVALAKDYGFDYVSFKPCLIRLEESRREALLEGVDKKKEQEIIESIKMSLEQARSLADGRIRVLESVNLKALLHGETERIKKQPRHCHMQFFRTVVSPEGIYHCPAFRGVDVAKIAGREGYLTQKKLDGSLEATGRSIQAFDAEGECRVVGCFYNETNWWLEGLIQSGKDVRDIESVEDENFFL